MPASSQAVFQVRRPLEGDRGVLVDLKDGFLPGRLVRELPPQGLETVVRDDLRRSEILEFCRICTGLFRQPDEQTGAVQIAVVVGADVGDEIGRVVPPDKMVSDLELHSVLLHYCLGGLQYLSGVTYAAVRGGHGIRLSAFR